jgi:K+-sensing histidine kinase KdpD
MAGSSSTEGQQGKKRRRNENQIAFIRTLAHDLRNPISGILAASQCLLEDASVFLDGPHVTLLRAIESASDLILHLIEDMLEIARADSGRLALRLRAANVMKLVEKSAAVQQKRADARSVRLNVTRDEDIPQVEIDTPKLKWALNALLANAIRSSEPGAHIQIHVAAKRKNVVIAVRRAGNEGSTRNADSRRSTSRHGRNQASALTVSTVRLIVEGHGGTLQAKQKTTSPAYTLTLPRLQARKAGAGVPKAASSGA